MQGEPSEFVEKYHSLEGNNICGDCGNKSVEWMVMKKGLSICVNCATIHRNFGVQHSRIRSIFFDKPLTRDQWEEFLNHGGNHYINQTIYEYNKPIFDISKKFNISLPNGLRRIYLINKYIDKLYIPSTNQSIDPSKNKCILKMPLTTKITKHLLFSKDNKIFGKTSVLHSKYITTYKPFNKIDITNLQMIIFDDKHEQNQNSDDYDDDDDDDESEYEQDDHQPIFKFYYTAKYESILLIHGYIRTTTKCKFIPNTISMYLVKYILDDTQINNASFYENKNAIFYGKRAEKDYKIDDFIWKEIMDWIYCINANIYYYKWLNEYKSSSLIVNNTNKNKNNTHNHHFGYAKIGWSKKYFCGKNDYLYQFKSSKNVKKIESAERKWNLRETDILLDREGESQGAKQNTIRLIDNNDIDPTNDAILKFQSITDAETFYLVLTKRWQTVNNYSSIDFSQYPLTNVSN